VPNAEAIEAAWKDPAQRMEERVIFRTKYDPLTAENLDKELANPLQASGQAFYITNGEPMAFWDYVHAVWKEMGHEPSTRIVIPGWLGMHLGSAAEWWAWLTGRKPGFTRERVGYSTRHRWFNIEKSRRVLGYEPDIGLVDGIRIAAQVRALLAIFRWNSY
jgi:sterol-4alpha-carboxylate 3-dehydrogenase (decarboxylating)